jgi:hypothetical protein
MDPPWKMLQVIVRQTATMDRLVAASSTRRHTGAGFGWFEFSLIVLP